MYVDVFWKLMKRHNQGPRYAELVLDASTALPSLPPLVQAAS